jgi:hypothetical protein
MQEMQKQASSDNFEHAFNAIKQRTKRYLLTEMTPCIRSMRVSNPNGSEE